MPQKKRQHYVPKFYMKSFSKNNFFNVFNLKKGTIACDVPFDSQCSKDYYYGKDQKWENILGKMEFIWSENLRNIIENNPYSLNIDEIKNLKNFTIYQRLRTTTHNEYMEKQQIETFKMLVEKYLFDSKAEISKSDLDKFLKEKLKSENIPQQSLEISNEMTSKIDDLSILIIEYKTKNELITSDNPVVIINPFDKRNIGICAIGIVLFFPVSPEKLIVIYDAKMYPEFRLCNYIELSDEEEVNVLNIYQYVNANEVLFAKNDFSFIYLKNNLENYKEVRDNCKDQVGASSLGTNENLLIYAVPRINMYNGSLSFTRLPKFVRKIPPFCREAIPRIYEKEYDEKLIAKEIILPITYKEKMFDTKYSISIKKICKGCKAMTNFAHYYWNKK